MKKVRFGGVASGPPFSESGSFSCLTDPEGKILAWNRRAARFSGYEASEVEGLGLSEILTRHGDRDDLLTRVLDIASNSGEGEDYLSLIAKDRSESPVRLRVEKLTGSNPIGFLATFFLMDSLPFDDALLHDIIEMSPTATMIAGSDGKILYINDQCERIFGYAREEIAGQQVEALLPERFRGTHPLFRAEYMRSPSPRPMGIGRELFARRKDGSEFPVEIGLNLVRSGGDYAALASIVDISDRKERDRVIEEALKEKEVLLQEVYHRVKNNLMVITSLFDLQMSQMPEGPNRDTLLEGANRVRAMALVHQKLYQSESLATIVVSEYFMELLQHLRGLGGTSARSVELHMEVDSIEIGPNLAIPLGLILNELVTNSYKHGFSGGRHGRLWVRLHSAGNEEVLLEIADDGVGFPQDFRPGQPGSLGLQLVTNLVRQIDGKIDFDSHEGAQVRITFRNPAGKVHAGSL